MCEAGPVPNRLALATAASPWQLRPGAPADLVKVLSISSLLSVPVRTATARSPRVTCQSGKEPDHTKRHNS